MTTQGEDVERRVYMDHSATTPVDQAVVEAMLPYFNDKFGNASTLYALGREAREAVERAREQVALGLGAAPEEIVFNSGGTESDNLGIKGVAYGRRGKGGHIITTSIEHPAVLNTCEDLGERGFEVTFLPVNEYGQVTVEELEASMREDTFLVSIGYGNHEIGTVQDIKELARIVHEHGALLHTDAVQAVTKLPIDVKDEGIDLLSLSGHKIYGPKGVGALYARKGVRLGAMMHGGGHEHQVRSGTENVPGIVGLGKAMELGIGRIETSVPRIRAMRDRLIGGILGSVGDSFLNGHPEKRLPHNAHFRFSYIEGEGIILNLDHLGIAAATGSACTSTSLKASHVLLAIGLKPEEAHGSLRLTLGQGNTDEEVDYVLEKVPQVVGKLRAMSPLGRGR